ncbi:MAG: preprotein translocase subunit SecE [Ruminococcaceae bacterium]|nr:preprotein translocase subunit SecE [Oscillospiraceae bacterium]
MADSNKNVKKNIFVRAWKAFTSFFKNIFLELKKVTWPTKQKVVANTISVIVFCVIIGLIIFLADLGLNSLLNFISGMR